jgi:NAD(P)-dependent dehydrogenase (short-subunit alcohol dehydrogenase family)
MVTATRSSTSAAVAAGVLAFAGWTALRRAREADLAGQVALVTGGSRGLGLLIAGELIEAGCRVAICARDGQELDAAREQLERSGARVVAVPCDVADAAQVSRMLESIESELGPVDLLVNNASIIQVGPLETFELEDFQHAMAVNFWGTVHTTRGVLPSMRRRRSGRIVNITSIGGKVAIPHLLPYDCAKFAVVGFSEGLRAEVAREGIRVTTVVPGLMRTGSPVNAFFKGDAEKEFAWFSLGDATPVSAMSARRAARQIVAAARRGDAEVTLSWQAKLLRLSHDLFPGPMTDLLGVVNRLLPTSGGGGEVRGMELATPLSPSPLTAMMNRAARTNNQYGGRPVPSARHAEKVGLEEDDREAAETGKRSGGDHGWN